MGGEHLRERASGCGRAWGRRASGTRHCPGGHEALSWREELDRYRHCGCGALRTQGTGRGWGAEWMCGTGHWIALRTWEAWGIGGGA